jgi:hypothetical protein
LFQIQALESLGKIFDNFFSLFFQATYSLFSESLLKWPGAKKEIKFIFERKRHEQRN